MKKQNIIKGLVTIFTLGLVVGCSSTNSNKTLLEQIKDNNKITVATEGTYPPFTYYNDKDELVGYDVEVARAVAKKLGVEIEFIETKWDGIIAGLDAKKYDIVVNQVGISDERKAKYDFSSAYTYSRGVIIVTKDNNDIKSFEDLNGKKAAQTATSNFAKIVEKYKGEIVGTEGFNQSIELVLQGRVDATVNDNVSFYDYLKQKPNANVKIAAQSDEISESAILIRKGETDLKDAINQALKELKEEGVLKEISEKYFNKDISVNN